MSYRNCMITCFNESEPEFDDTYMRYLVYQQERAPTTGTLHWQGYVEFNRNYTLKQIKSYFNDNKMHIEKRYGTREEARNYCMKSATRIQPPVEHGSWKTRQGERTDLHQLVDKIKHGASDLELIESDPEMVNRYMKFIQHVRHVYDVESNKDAMKEFTDVVLNDNQKVIMNHIENQNKRQITWVFDEKGNTGKTFLTQHLIAKHNAVRFTNGKTKDIAYAYNKESIVAFDFARSCEERINYQIIEDLKNGMLFSSKYTSQCKMFKPPKIVIMANFMPDKSKLSDDRWDIINLNPKQETDILLNGNTTHSDISLNVDDFI